MELVERLERVKEALESHDYSEGLLILNSLSPDDLAEPSIQRVKHLILEYFMDRTSLRLEGQTAPTEALRAHAQERSANIDEEDSEVLRLIPDKRSVLLSSLLRLTEQIDKVPGFLSHREGALLYSLAEKGPADGEIVELGSFMGRSTVWLASGSKSMRREKITAIDTHTGSSEHQDGGCAEHLMPKEKDTFAFFKDNMLRFNLQDWVWPLRCKTCEAARSWQKPVRLLFIDADHSIEGTLADFQSWEQYVCPGGIIAFHDYRNGFPGPQYVVENYIKKNPSYKPLGCVDTIFCAQKM